MLSGIRPIGDSTADRLANEAEKISLELGERFSPMRLRALRGRALALGEEFETLLSAEEFPETMLERAYCAFLFEIDEALRKAKEGV